MFPHHNQSASYHHHIQGQSHSLEVCTYFVRFSPFMTLVCMHILYVHRINPSKHHVVYSNLYNMDAWVHTHIYVCIRTPTHIVIYRHLHKHTYSVYHVTQLVVHIHVYMYTPPHIHTVIYTPEYRYLHT